MRCLLPLFLPALSIFAAAESPLGHDSQRRESVPKGTITQIYPNPAMDGL